MACAAATETEEAFDSTRTSRRAAADYSAAVINYNGGRLLLETVDSLKAMRPAPDEILVVDDGSTDESLDLVCRAHPDVRIVALGRNTRRPTVVRHRALAEARHRMVLLTDNDILFAPDAVAVLAETMRADPRIAVCRPAILFKEHPEQVCTLGNRLHFLCWASAMARPGTPFDAEQAPFDALGVGIAMIDRARIARSGGFDEGFVLGWGDDGELHYRLATMGLRSVTVPGARAYHARVRETPRIYGQARNRLRMLLVTYEARTLVLLAPVLLAFEIALASFLLGTGRGGAYFRGVADAVRSLPDTWRQRRRVQALRCVADGDLLSEGMPDMPGTVTRNRLLDRPIRALFGAFTAYWRVARLFLRHKRAEGGARSRWGMAWRHSARSGS